MFCLDTSALLDAGTRWYPRDLFPSLWVRLTEAADNGVIVSPDEVLRELSKKDDDVYAWAKAQSKMFMPLDEAVQKAVSDILAKFPRLVDTMKDRSHGDPFVIAVAKVSKRIVVTGEKAVGSTQRPRIPNVCGQYGIEYIMESNTSTSLSSFAVRNGISDFGCGLNGLGDLQVAAKHIRQLHLSRSLAFRLEQSRTRNKNARTAGSGCRHVETVDVV